MGSVDGRSVAAGRNQRHDACPDSTKARMEMKVNNRKKREEKRLQDELAHFYIFVGLLPLEWQTPIPAQMFTPQPFHSIEHDPSMQCIHAPRPRLKFMTNAHPRPL